MGELQGLAQALVADAQERAAMIERERESEVARIDCETERLVAEAEARLASDARKTRDAMARQMAAETAAKDARSTLALKNGLVAEAFEKAATELSRMRRAERDRLLRSHWERARTGMTVDHVDVARKDASFFTRKATVRSATEWSGGFVAYTKGRKVSYDARFETLLEEARERCKGAVADALFAQRPESRARQRRRGGRA